jgi:hypothetical protein
VVSGAYDAFIKQKKGEGSGAYDAFIKQNKKKGGGDLVHMMH